MYLRANTIGVATLGVKERPDNALWKGLSDVADFLANLIPYVRYVSALHGAFEGDENRRCAGNRIAADVVEARSFLELLLDPICDLLKRIRYVGTGPHDLNHHGLDSKIRVFIAA